MMRLYKATSHLLLWIFFFFPCHAAVKYHLSVCAIFQNEAPYLKEWIEFHRLLGVEHFYLYNHRSIDNYQEVLQPYISAGIVELKNQRKQAKSIKNFNALQCKCYTECLSHAKGMSKWVAFIDIDEFLFPAEEQNLNEILKEFEEFGGVGVNWLMFGPSHVWKIPSDRLLIETLTRSSTKEFSGNRYVKSIVQPEHATRFANPHQPMFEKGFFEVDTDKLSFNGMSSPYRKHDKLRINHYWTRDGDFFYRTKMRQHKRWRGNPTNEAIEAFIQNLNAQEETTILRFVPSLKEKINQSES